MKTSLTHLFDEKTERRLQAVARSAYNESPYGHGKWDAQSAEVSVADEIQKLGHSPDDAFEIAREIAARVVSDIDEERAAIYEEEEAHYAALRLID